MTTAFYLCVAQTARVYPVGDWSPWLVGALIGILVVLTMYVSDKPLGASGAYAQVCGLLGKTVAPQHTMSLPYYAKSPPRINWELMLVGFVIVGALVAAWHGGELTGYAISPMWEAQFGDNLWLRLGAALLGGIIMAFGARLAGGCTSGHGISGALQLSVGSWVALICFFIGGIVIAKLMYGA